MGRDGLEGAMALVGAGGSVLVQDEATSAVWGMPRAVAEAGLACAILPPARIARRIAHRIGERRMQVSDSSSRILAGLLEARTGQQLTMSRRWRIETALSSLLRERGIATLDELITILVMGREPALANLVVEALLNNETYFFRDRQPFDLLSTQFLPRAGQAARRQEASQDLVGGLLDRAGALFAGDAVRRRSAQMAGLDDRHPRHRRVGRDGRPRAGRHSTPSSRSSAGSASRR